MGCVRRAGRFAPALLATGILAGWSPVARAATYFVGPTGCSDSGPGSETEPFCTLMVSAKRLQAGDTLNLLTGTFKEQLSVTVAGTAAAPVVIQAAPDASPVIDGKGLPLNNVGLVNLAGAQHLTLRNVAVQNSTFFCVHVVNAETVTLESVRVDGCEHGGLVAVNSSNLKITMTETSRTDLCPDQCVHDALTLSGVKGFTVSGSFVHGGSRDGIVVKSGSQNGKVFGNVVQDMDGVGLLLAQITAVDVYENDLHGNRQEGLQLATGLAATGTPTTNRNQVYRNVIWNNTLSGIRFLVQAAGELRENKIYNNDLYGNAQSGILLGDDATTVKDNVLRNNIFMNNTQGALTGQARTANTISNCLFALAADSAGENAVIGDPKFANVGFGNFHLTDKSPAIDAGYEMGLPKVGAPDIGAFEYGLAVITDAGPKVDGGDGPVSRPASDPGCGCASAAHGVALAEGWPLLLLVLGWLRARAAGRRGTRSWAREP